MRSKKDIAAGLALFVAGGLTVWLFDHAVFAKKQPPQADPQALFNNFLNEEDPFERVRKMQEQMEQSVLQGQLGGGFQQTFTAGGDVSQREDDKFVYFDVDLGDGTLKEMQAEVRGGQLEIHGVLESKNEQGGMTSSFTSSFNQSLPVPPGVDAEKFRMNQEGKKLVISFPKTGS